MLEWHDEGNTATLLFSICTLVPQYIASEDTVILGGNLSSQAGVGGFESGAHTCSCVIIGLCLAAVSGSEVYHCGGSDGGSHQWFWWL